MSASAHRTTEQREGGHDSSVDAGPSVDSLSSLAGESLPGVDADRTYGLDPSPSRLRFDGVYEEFFEFVWRSARRLGVHEASLDDVAQDVFLVVHRRLSEFEGRSSVKTWLFGITLRVVADWRRTKRRKGGLLELPPEDVLGCAKSGPDGVLEQTERAQLLYALLEQLADDKREVFVMIELEELTAPEVATLLSVPLNTVYSRLRVAREEFERALARHRAKEASAHERAQALGHQRAKALGHQRAKALVHQRAKARR